MAGIGCVYLGPELEGKSGLFECRRFGRCVIEPDKGRGLPNCATCKERLPPNHQDFSDRWVDPLRVTDRTGKDTDCLRGLLAGRSVFLVCGGPSANQLPLERLNWKGCWSMAVNNMAAHPRFRPQAFVCADPPLKFSNSIWLDPGIMKFVPIPKLSPRRGRIRTKEPDGSIVWLKRGDQFVSTRDCPNVWGFARRSWLLPDDTFFTEPSAAWGNHDKGVQRTGQPKTVCTMLLAFRLLKYLGAKRVFLVGVDFLMSGSRGPTGNYAFGEERTTDAIRSNNEQYEVVNGWLCKMQKSGVFKRFGIEFFNCNRFSQLRAFPYVPFHDALKHVTAGVDQEPDLVGWYAK